MNRSDLETLTCRYLDGTATPAETSTLSELLENNEEARRTYLGIARVHAALASDPASIQQIEQVSSRNIRSLPSGTGAARRWLRSLNAPMGLAACGAGLLLVAWLIVAQSSEARAAARFGALNECRWVGRAEVRTGDAIRQGQVLQLSSGSVQLHFASGAEVTLLGPAIFEVRSRNSGFLTLGQLKANAATPQSKGFTVHTRTARVVDVGTEFFTAAAADGQSRVDVTDGEVDVLVDGIASPHRLRTGDALSVEAGRAQVMVRIESGDNTADFRFPTIEPPSSSDLADASLGRARIRVVKGGLHMTAHIPSGPPELLLDGRGQSAPNSPAESVYFDNNASGLLLMDLGQRISVSKINTYSWHQSPDAVNRVRAVQKFTLYGFDGDVAPPTDGGLPESGWVQLARVNSDDFFDVMQPIDRPAQQACSITGARGHIGRYRFLLWAVEPTQSRDPQYFNNTFYAEFDVYGTF